jgi:hypothetical protein
MLRSISLSRALLTPARTKLATVELSSPAVALFELVSCVSERRHELKLLPALIGQARRLVLHECAVSAPLI